MSTDNPSILSRVLRGTEWCELGSYLSPTFFDVVSPLRVATTLGKLTKTMVTRAGYDAACEALNASHAAADVLVKAVSAAEFAALDAPTARSDGDLVLRLYFHQLFNAPGALLDFRCESFRRAGAGGLAWRPAPLLVAWDPAFIANIRALYRGFYDGQSASFDQALAALGLDTAKAELIAHFGADQSAVRFDLAEFRASFHSLFAAAKAGKRQLHADFLGFGIGLVCLYEHLERLGGTFDVRAAFTAATAPKAGR